MAEYRQNTPYEEISEDKKNSGNTGLPFGLCKKFGVPLSKDATPREAWEALKGVGITPEQGYEMAKKGLQNVNVRSQAEAKSNNIQMQNEAATFLSENGVNRYEKREFNPSTKTTLTFYRLANAFVTAHPTLQNATSLCGHPHS